MKNNHVILLNILFISNFMFAANPAPDKKEEEKGTFDRCFDGPGGFVKCAGVGALAVGGTGLAIYLSGGVLSPWMTRIGGSISGAFESKPAPKHEPKPAAAPKPAPAPAKKEEPKPAPAPSSPKRSAINHQQIAAAAAGGFTMGAVLVPPLKAGMKAAIERGVNEIADDITGKRAKQDKKEQEQVALQKESLDIQRRAVAAQEEAIALQKKEFEDQKKRHAEDMLVHMRISEQNEKVLAQGKSFKEDMTSLSKQLNDFAGNE
jgi:hypothetical protein